MTYYKSKPVTCKNESLGHYFISMTICNITQKQGWHEINRVTHTNNTVCASISDLSGWRVYSSYNIVKVKLETSALPVSPEKVTNTGKATLWANTPRHIFCNVLQM